MNIKNSIILLIALLVCIGVGSGFYILFTQTKTTIEAPLTTDSTTGYTTNTSTTDVQTHLQVKSKSVTYPSLDSLFSKLGARKVMFTTVSSSGGVTGSVYAQYASDIADVKKTFPKLNTFAIDIAMVDLNKDSVPEAIVWENLPGICGSGGCPLDIYQKTAGTWTKLLNTTGGRDIAVASTTTNGFTDLLMVKTGDIGYQSKVVRFVLHKTEYVDANIVATWDGSQFSH